MSKKSRFIVDEEDLEIVSKDDRLKKQHDERKAKEAQRKALLASLKKRK